MQVKMENILWQYAKYCHVVEQECSLSVSAINTLLNLESRGHAVRIEDGDVSVTWRATPAFLPGRERGPLVTFGPDMQEIVLFN
jgi:hypothetical protein